LKRFFTLDHRGQITFWFQNFQKCEMKYFGLNIKNQLVHDFKMVFWWKKTYKKYTRNLQNFVERLQMIILHWLFPIKFEIIDVWKTKSYRQFSREYLFEFKFVFTVCDLCELQKTTSGTLITCHNHSEVLYTRNSTPWR